MKIISLNTWGGRAGKEKLLAFMKVYANTTDIFCLQEIWSAPYQDVDGKIVGGTRADYNDIMIYGLKEITNIPPDHVPYFRPHHLDNYGLLMLVHKNLHVVEENEFFVHKEKGYIPDGDIGHHARNVQYIAIKKDTTPLYVMNFHGLWNGKGKTDSEDRIQQSEKIISHIKKLQGEVILCGDFNLLPDTKSIQMLEDIGLRNLIKENNITSTRTSHYAKSDKFADYAFISKGVYVNEFKVLPDEVSDHSPLFLDIEIEGSQNNFTL